MSWGTVVMSRDMVKVSEYDELVMFSVGDKVFSPLYGEDVRVDYIYWNLFTQRYVVVLDSVADNPRLKTLMGR